MPVWQVQNIDQLSFFPFWQEYLQTKTYQCFFITFFIFQDAQTQLTVSKIDKMEYGFLAVIIHIIITCVRSDAAVL